MRGTFASSLEGPTQRSGVESLDQELELQKLRERLNILPRPGLFGRLSPLGRTLITLVATQLGIVEAHYLMPNTSLLSAPEAAAARPRRIRSERVNQQGTPTETQEQHAPHLEATGLEQIHLNNRRFAERFATVMAPFMDHAAYRVEFTRQPAELSDIYFGIHGQHGPHHDHRPHEQGRGHRSHHGHRRWIELAHHQFLENGDHSLVLREAALESGNLDIRAFCITAVHEVIHGLGREHLAYFVGRVHEKDRIPFPYTEHFLEAHRHGDEVEYEHMADEYRSKLIETFFAVGEVPMNASFEDAVVQYICERYRVSEAGAYRDVRQVISWFPIGFWERHHAEYRNFVRETGIEFETGTIQERLIQPLKEEALRQVLQDVLTRRVPTRHAQLYQISVPVDAAGTALSRLLQDVRNYQGFLVEEYEAQLRQEYPELVPFLQDWRTAVEFVAERNRSHLQILEQADVPVNQRLMTDEQEAQRFMGSFPTIHVEQLNREWQALSPQDRERLQAALIEYTRVLAHDVRLPDVYLEQAEAYLASPGAEQSVIQN